MAAQSAACHRVTNGKKRARCRNACAEPETRLLAGSRSGFNNYNLRTVDAFGNITIVPRAKARKAEYTIAYQTGSHGRILAALEAVADRPTFFVPQDTALYQMGLLVFGVAEDFYPPLSASGFTTASLEVLGAA